MKSNNLNRKTLEHLQLIGYKFNESIEELIDSPYILFGNDILHKCTSAQTFRDYNGQFKTQEQLLKLRPKEESKDFKKVSKKEQELYKLMKLLNTQKVSKITGYDVSWTIQEKKYAKGEYEILPISPHASGCISMEHLEIILEFSKKHPWLHPALSYTNYNQEKERYETCTPCIHFY